MKFNTLIILIITLSCHNQSNEKVQKETLLIANN